MDKHQWMRVGIKDVSTETLLGPSLKFLLFLPPSCFCCWSQIQLKFNANPVTALPPVLKLEALPCWPWRLPIHFILEGALLPSHSDSRAAALWAERSHFWPRCSCPRPLHAVQSVLLVVPLHELIQVIKPVQNYPEGTPQLRVEAGVPLCLLIWWLLQFEVSCLLNCKWSLRKLVGWVGQEKLLKPFSFRFWSDQMH